MTPTSIVGTDAAEGRQAVVDIGSNSVRLVIFDGPRRAPVQIVNEKALCGLGRNMTADRRLDPAAAGDALVTLARFRRLIAGHGEPPTRAIATSAVREAADGPEFVRAVEQLGFAVEVIDGAEEALLAAMGVLSYEPGATGLVGDMGGGSLELAGLDAGALAERTSLSIGPLRLMQQTGDKPATAAPLVERALDDVSWLTAGRFPRLYSVGGSWRAIARIHLAKKAHPLSVLHHYELPATDAASICDLIARQTPRSLQEMPGVSRRRLDTLPYAAIVFRAVLARTGAESVVISAGGIREGVLYRDLSDAERALDPLMEGAQFFADRLSPEPAFGAALAEMVSALFVSETEAEARIRRATCALVDIGAYFHPDMRAMHAFDTALRAPFYGVTHTERIAMALSLFCRHEGRKPSFADPDAHGARLLAILSDAERDRAVRLGLAMRFGAALAPKSPQSLSGCSLGLEAGRLVFRAPKDRAAFAGELPRRRLAALAAAFDAEPCEDFV